MNYLPLQVGQFYVIDAQPYFHFYFITKIDLEGDIDFYYTSFDGIATALFYEGKFTSSIWWKKSSWRHGGFENAQNVTHKFISSVSRPTFKQPLSNWVKIEAT